MAVYWANNLIKKKENEGEGECRNGVSLKFDEIFVIFYLTTNYRNESRNLVTDQR